jgi:hypothetical protein
VPQTHLEQPLLAQFNALDKHCARLFRLISHGHFLSKTGNKRLGTKGIAAKGSDKTNGILICHQLISMPASKQPTQVIACCTYRRNHAAVVITGCKSNVSQLALWRL